MQTDINKQTNKQTEKERNGQANRNQIVIVVVAVPISSILLQASPSFSVYIFTFILICCGGSSCNASRIYYISSCKVSGEINRASGEP